MRLVWYSLTIIPVILTLPLIWYFGYITGKSLAYTNLIYNPYNSCVWLNTMAAHSLFSKSNYSGCIFILLNEKHVRYLYLNGTKIVKIDLTCPTQCDNMTYKILYSCGVGDAIWTVPVANMKYVDFVEYLRKRINQTKYEEKRNSS